MTVAMGQLLSAGKGAELIRAKTGRNCSRQNLDKLVKQGKLPRSTASSSPVRVRADLLVEEYLDSIDQRQAVRDDPGVKARPVSTNPAPTARSGEPLADDELPAYTISQQRKAYEQANLLEIERRQKEGHLVERVEVEKAWGQSVAIVKTALLGVPSKAKERIPHLTLDEIEVITVLIRDALEEVSNDAAE